MVMKDILKVDKADLIVVFVSLILSISSCSNEPKTGEKQLDTMKISMSTIGENEYWRIYNSIVDSLKSWDKNELGNFNFATYGKKMVIDSVLCFNSKKDKLISNLLNFNTKNTISDGINEFYGAKIDDKWYFWTGGYTPVSRDFKGHNKRKPLSYKQLHSMVGYGSYLDQNGNIRDEWFEGRFKSSGWYSYKDRYMYKSILDGLRIDTEKEYWEYAWKRNGLGLCIAKVHKDSIAQREQLEGKPLADEEKREISMAVSRKMMNTKFPLYKGKYKS